MTDEQFDHLSALAERIVRESGGGTHFDARAWVTHWVVAHSPALGGKPIDFLNTPDGYDRVCTLIAQMQSATYG